MKAKSVIAVTVTAFSLGAATATLFDFEATLEEADPLALSPISIGNAAKAAAPMNDVTELDTAVPVPSVDEAMLVGPIDIPDVERTVKLKSGNTLSGVLVDAGLERQEAAYVVEAFSDVHSPRKIKAGQELVLSFTPDPETGIETFSTLRYEPTTREVVTVARADEGFTASKAEKTLNVVERRVDARIDDSLYMAGVRNDLPVPVLIELIRAYSWDVDFQRDIRQGDSFSILFEQLEDENGAVVDYGEIQYARITLSGDELPIYRFETEAGFVDYFNDKGQSAKKALMRTPIDGARLSSGFGKRKHPILGYTKMHKGVDFAAPRGTPIYAAGDGVVEFAARNGGYGKFIRIRHNGEYKTQYAHLNGYAKGIKKGKRVRQGQIIGYVGTTGRSTGPHLHYEVVKGSKQVNPMKIKMPSGEKLAGAQLERFNATARAIGDRYTELTPGVDVAEN